MPIITLQEPGQLSFTPGDSTAEPGEGEVLVRIHHVGVCGTDIHAFHGRQPFFSYPRILGHELGVELLACGPGVTALVPGTRGCVLPYLACGECIACRRQRPNCCTDLRVLGVHCDGGMRDHLLIPANAFIPADDLATEQLALVEMLGIGCHAVGRADLHQGEQVLINGAGPIGLAAAQFALLAGAKVAVADIDASRRAACARLLAVDTLIDASADDAGAEALADWTAGDGPVAVLDATGHRGSMQNCFTQMAAGGRIVFIGLVLDDISFNDPEFHRRETTVMSSRNATREDFTDILADIRAGRIDTNAWISHPVQAETFIDAFTSWQRSKEPVLKSVIAF